MHRILLAKAQTIEEARVKADNFRQAHSRVQIRRRSDGFAITDRQFDNAAEGKASLEKRRAAQAFSDEAENGLG